jgi:protein-S-isoprenylcysteine O-methyltransferase Ste14
VIPRIPGPALLMGAWCWLVVPMWLGGIAIMTWCAVDFVRKGRGTPVPIDPPKELVTSGLYRCVRNPMYMGALLIQVGNITWFGSLAQVVYWFFLFIGFSLFIRANEEPFLRKTFGVAYETYCRTVPRMIPRWNKR